MANYATSALKLTDTYVNTLPYNTCTIAGGTAAKTVNAGTFALETGAMVVVKFSNTNTTTNATLNVSSTGAKPIWYNGTQVGANVLKGGRVYQFVYDGTDADSSKHHWDLIGDPESESAELVAGTNITLTPNTSNNTITISATDTHYTTGITAGASGTTSNSATSNPYVKIKDNSTHRGQIQIKGGGATSVSSDANGVITITSTDTNINTTYSAGAGLDLNGTTFTNSAAVYFLSKSSFTTTAGNGTSGSYLSTKWSVPNVDGITTPFDGMQIAVRVPAVGVTTAGIVLSINGTSGTYYPVVRLLNSAITTHYAENSTMLLTFNASQTATAYLTSNTSSTVTGCWQIGDYDSNTKTTTGTSNKTGTKLFLAGATSQSSSGATTYSNSNCYVGTDNCLYSGGQKVSTTDHTHTITANATDGIFDITGTNGTNAVTYAVAPYSAQQAKRSFDTSTTNPSRSDRLNYNGYFYATKLYSGGKEVSTTDHTHSSYANQNAFSNIKVGSTTVAADTTTDTVEFEGSNITITPSTDTTTDKITFSLTKTNVTTALGYSPANAANLGTAASSNAVDFAPAIHNHAATDITSGLLSSEILPTVPISKGGTGATSVDGALTALGFNETWILNCGSATTVI